MHIRANLHFVAVSGASSRSLCRSLHWLERRRGCSTCFRLGREFNLLMVMIRRERQPPKKESDWERITFSLPIFPSLGFPISISSSQQLMKIFPRRCRRRRRCRFIVPQQNLGRQAINSNDFPFVRSVPCVILQLLSPELQNNHSRLFIP